MKQRRSNLFKLLLAYTKINFRSVAVYKTDFWLGVLGNILIYGAELLALFYIFDLVHDMQGWIFTQLLLLSGFNQACFSLWASFFINTITLPYYIKRGDFDRFLLRPIPPLFQIMLDGFDDDSWGDLLVGIILIAYAWLSLEIPGLYLLFLPIIVVSGALIYAAISVALSTVSFYTVAQADVANLTSEFQRLAQYPITIYPRTIQIMLTVFCPLSFVAFIPAAALLGKMGIVLLVLLPFVAIMFFVAACWLWNRGLIHYESTGT